jgi:CubicO group peptidase (beta-lactamase class C family)
LTRAVDAQPGTTGGVRVGAKPGAAWRYSGGGFLLLQLLIEEVTHEPFNDYMHRAVFQPLRMNESTFVDPESTQLAENFMVDGSKLPLSRFTALSAASLFTSAEDLTRFLHAQLQGSAGTSSDRDVLTPATLAAMRMPTARLMGLPIWGLGEILYAPNGAGSYILGHDGNNFPAINTTVRTDPSSGDAIIVLETGREALASEIGGEWTFWRTRRVGLDTLVLFDAQNILIVLAIGALGIIAGGIRKALRPCRALAPAPAQNQ